MQIRMLVNRQIGQVVDYNTYKDCYVLVYKLLTKTQKMTWSIEYFEHLPSEDMLVTVQCYVLR